MRLTKDYIINHIRETKYPCWSLFVMQNYKRAPIMHYNGDDFAADDDASAKAEKAVARLDGALQSIPPDTLLCIELRSSKGANGSQGMLGPFEFTNRNKDDDPGMIPQQPAANFAGFGFVQPPPGWITEETLNGKLEQLAARNENKINEILLQQREKEFSERMRRERQELAELRKELNEEKKKYESNTGAAAETLVFAVKKILAELFPDSAIVGALAGTQQQDEQPSLSDGGRPTDAKYSAVEALANAMYQDDNLTEKDVNDIALAIKQRAAMKCNAPSASTAEATVVQSPKEAGGQQNV